LITARATGPFTTLADAISRADGKNLTRSAIESLVKAGAVDDIGRPGDATAYAWRSRLLASLDRAVALGQQRRRMREIGQHSLFAVVGAAEDDFIPERVPEQPRQQILAWEKELLGLYLSAHPLAHVANLLKKRVTTYTSLLNEEWAGQKVTLGGRVTEVRRIMTKKGDAMAAVQLEDTQGSIEVVVFPKVFAVTSASWREDAVLLVTGTVSLRNDEPQIAADAVEEFIPTDEEVNRREYLLRIRLRRGASDPREIAQADQVMTALARYPGDDQYELVVRNGRWEARIERRGAQGVLFCPELMQRLEEILGPGSVEARQFVQPTVAAM
jgi:DNA polymerase III subunit alpha